MGPAHGEVAVSGDLDPEGRLGVSWLSAGALLRNAARTDREIAQLIALGELVPDAVVDSLVARSALQAAGPGIWPCERAAPAPAAPSLWYLFHVFKGRLPQA